MKGNILFGIIFFIILGSFCGYPVIGTPGNVSAQTQDDWKQEFESICAKTQNAMALSAEELHGLIDRCEKLQERIDKLDGPQAATEQKVYTKRLKMCRDLYDFALGYKENKEQ